MDNKFFGSYPQSRVNDKQFIKKLESLAGSPEKNLDVWTSYRFYMSGQKSDYMFYTDVTVDNNKYRGVYIKRHRPYSVSGDSSNFDERGYQDNFGYRLGKVYWFLYEPIEFDALADGEDGTLLYSRYVLDAMQFDKAGWWEYVSYTDSELRAWLNDTFFNTAFSNGEKAALVGLGEDKDKVSLLSVEEYKRYCGKGGSWRENNRRTTDYAQCMGVDAESAYGICNFYWLRTVKKDDALDAVFYGVGTLGDIDSLHCYAGNMGGGVAPAILIKAKAE